jgi:formylglycine-generating enzyme required for sulfatase activity
MGFVFRAEDDHLCRPVALKVMRPEVALKRIDRERFLREGRAAAAVRSDHIITIHRVGEENGVPFLDMEFCQGGTLEDWLIARTEPVTASEVLWVARDTLRGLAAAHKGGLIHRDVKPANLWMDAETSRIKLLDFGITRRTGVDPTITGTGDIVGTPAYMPPEQAHGLEVDARTDLFSLGAVLYRMLSGRSPFQRQSSYATLIALATENPPSVASFNLPANLAALIDRLLAKDPGRRPQTATEALDVVLAVERALLAPTTVPPVQATIPHVPVARPSIHPVAVVVPTTAPPAEVEEEFEYVIEGEKRKGTRRVLGLDIGGGQTMKFVRIGKGAFLMGAPEGEEGAESDEKPQHRVTISRAFYIGMYAVTQVEYKIVTGQSPSQFKGDRMPVESVAWRDALAFCQRLTDLVKRQVELPTEAQWEYACRAGTTTPFHFGSKLTGDLANCDGNHPYGTNTKGAYKAKTVEVGTYPANPWGLYDMHGNVWEWCRDEYGPYAPGDQTDPVQLPKQSKDSRRVLRGGAWDSNARYCRASFRSRSTPVNLDDGVGFRVCLPLD